MRCRVRILFADPARNHRPDTDRKPDCHRIHDGHHRLGESDRRDRIGAQLGDEEDISNRKDAFHHHLQDHRDGEEKDGAAERAVGVVVMLFAAHGIAHDVPHRLRRGHGCFDGL